MFLLVLAHPGFPGQIPQSRKTVVCVCVLLLLLLLSLSLLLLLLLYLLLLIMVTSEDTRSWASFGISLGENFQADPTTLCA